MRTLHSEHAVSVGPAVTKKTGTGGKVSFRLRATRYPGRVSFRVTKLGFTAATYTRSVRLG